MKKIILCIFCLNFIFSFSAFSQRRDNIWMLGFASCFGNPFQTPGINFNSGIADTFSMIRRISFFVTNTSICDTSGNLLFYTNGVRIGNVNHDTLFNSDNFNSGYASTINCETLNVPQGVLILPKPDNDSLFYLFHESGEYFTAYGYPQQQPLNLKLSVIDKNLDGGLGGIIPGQKGLVIINDTMNNGWITACKHGNGRDWWIVTPRFHSNRYYKLLVTNDSIYNIQSQSIGDSIIFNTLGQGVFSPDGSWYANVDIVNNLNIFRFDRCTGLFYDSTYIQIPNPTPSTFDNQPYSVAFSANSRFLYVILYTKIIQYDTWASNIATTQTYVALWDTAYMPTETRFYNAQLAPDNKVYVSTYGGTYTLHYIDQPDSLGLACNVVQNSFIISTNGVGNGSVPTFPNYDLGRWVGSPCDTLTGIEETKNDVYSIKIFPNPASNYFFINYEIKPNQIAKFILYDSFGRVVESKNLYGSFKSLLIHTEKLRGGIYFWKVASSDSSFQTGKLVIVR